MKTQILLILLFLTTVLFAQDKMTTRTGQIFFEASVPSFEEVTATNDRVSCVLNTKTGEISSFALLKEFRFKLALMEEHFNKNYVESDDYPKSTFNGLIQGFNCNIIGSSRKEFKMNGILEIHGKSKEIATTVFILKVDGGFEIISDFKINLDDFGIMIPSIVSTKVSKTIVIRADFLVK